MSFELNPQKFVKITRETEHPAELLPEVQQFLRAVVREEMKPGQKGQIIFSQESLKKISGKYPIRTLTDYLRRQLRKTGRARDYYLRKSEKFHLIDVHFLPEIEHTAAKAKAKAAAGRKRSSSDWNEFHLADAPSRGPCEPFAH